MRTSPKSEKREERRAWKLSDESCEWKYASHRGVPGRRNWNRPDEFEISAKGWSLLSRISLMMRAKLAKE